MTNKDEILSEKITKNIDKWIAKFPPEQKQSAILPALLIAQEENAGWLSDQIIEAVANYLEIPKIAAFEVATFYNMFELKPVGKHKIYVCNNISCLLRGCDKIIERLHNKLKIGMNETTQDGRFTLKEVECMASCVTAPMMQIDKTYYENLTPEKVDQIIDALD